MLFRSIFSCTFWTEITFSAAERKLISRMFSFPIIFFFPVGHQRHQKKLKKSFGSSFSKHFLQEARAQKMLLEVKKYSETKIYLVVLKTSPPKDGLIDDKITDRLKLSWTVAFVCTQQQLWFKMYRRN